MTPQLIVLTGDQYRTMQGDPLAWFDKNVLQKVYKDPAVTKITSGVLTTAGLLLAPITGGASLVVTSAISGAFNIAASAQKPNEQTYVLTADGKLISQEQYLQQQEQAKAPSNLSEKLPSYLMLGVTGLSIIKHLKGH